MVIGRIISILIALAIIGIVSLFLGYAPHKQPSGGSEIESNTANANGGIEEVVSREQVAVDEVSELSESVPTATEQAQPRGFHVIDLTDQEEANLLQAPSVFLNREPSDVLARAMEIGHIDYTRADRDFDNNEYVTQGWIFYEPIDGQIPVVLCLSQTQTIIDWMYCQEETRAQTGRPE